MNGDEAIPRRERSVRRASAATAAHAQREHADADEATVGVAGRFSQEVIKKRRWKFEQGVLPV